MIKITFCDSTGLALEGLTGDIVSACSASGDVSAAVEDTMKRVDIGFPLTAEDNDALASRLLWLACCDLSEEMSGKDIPARFWQYYDFDSMEWSDKPLTTMSTCYEIWTSDDIDAGEDSPSDAGYESQDVAVSAYDIDRLLGNVNAEWSSSRPARGDWLMVSGEPDYRTGETENKSYHFPRDIDADVFDFIVWRSEQ